MKQLKVKCSKCGFELTYNQLDDKEISITEFVKYGNIWLCMHCYKRKNNV